MQLYKMNTAKKLTCLLALCIVLCVLPACTKSWQGYENENLDRYLSYGTLGEIKYVYCEVSDEDVEKEMSDRLEALATDTALTDGRAFGDGCSALINAFAADADGKELTEAALNNVLCVAGRGDSVTGAITQAMYGTHAGESFSVNVKIPAGYFRELKAETDAVFSVSILCIYSHSVPDLTDDVCATILPGSKGAEHIRKEIRQNIKEEREKELNEAAAYAVWNEYLATAFIKKLPYEVYMSYYNHLEYPYEVLAEAAEKSLDEYIADATGMTKREFESLLSSKALEKTKNALLVHATAKKAGLTCDNATLEMYAEKIAGQSDGEFENGESYIEYMGEDEVRCDCLLEMIFDYYTVR